jgi:hypothetical protein
MHEARFAMRDKEICSGAPPPPAKLVRRAVPPKPVQEEALSPEPVSLGRLGAKATRPVIDAFLDGLPDQELS